jgi:hypothetical protein
MTETGIWNQAEADLYHKSSPKLAAFLCRYLDPSIQVVDFGCGQGFYISELESVGFKCVGIEGLRLNNFLTKNIRIADLSKPYVFIDKLNVLSFETGEHIPQEFEETFLDNITIPAIKLIMSWATPGQGGVGHVNLRSHEYIINKIESRGFKLNTVDTAIIRRNVDKQCDWLERNLLIFDRL